MKSSITTLSLSTVLTIGLFCFNSPAFGQKRSDLEQQLSKRIQQQQDAQDGMKTLAASLNERPSSPSDLSTIRSYSAYYDDQLQIVVEEHTVEGTYLRKDYHMDKGKVFALMVEHHQPTADGKSKRIVENGFGFDAGKLALFSTTSYRVGTDAERDPKQAAKNEKDHPIPEGFDAWQEQLTTRAWSLVYRMAAAVKDDEQPLFGLWNLAPPPAEAKKNRPKGWTPTKETLTLPIHDVISPDGRYGISWGYEKGPVDWEKLRYVSDDDEEFSSKLAINVPDALKEDTTFIRNAISGRDAGILGISHGGERQRFNHDEIIASWSPSGNICIARETFKWGDNDVRVCWMDAAGKVTKSQALLVPLAKQVEAHVAKSKHPAAAEAKEGNFMIAAERLIVEDNGTFEAKCTGHNGSKRGGPKHFFQMIVQGKVQPGEGDECKLTITKRTLLPPIKEEE